MACWCRIWTTWTRADKLRADKHHALIFKSNAFQSSCESKTICPVSISLHLLILKYGVFEEKSTFEVVSYEFMKNIKDTKNNNNHLEYFEDVILLLLDIISIPLAWTSNFLTNRIIKMLRFYKSYEDINSTGCLKKCNLFHFEYLNDGLLNFIIWQYWITYIIRTN